MNTKELKAEVERLNSELTKARELMYEFCERVENGEVRSKRTYANFKSFLAHRSAPVAQLFQNKGTGNWAVCELKGRVWSPVSPPFKHKLDAAKWLADKQSAPAAKGESDE